MVALAGNRQESIPPDSAEVMSIKLGNLTVVQHAGCPARQIRDCTVQIAANQFLMFMQHTLREFPEP